MKVKSLAALSMAAVSFLIGCGGNSNDKKYIDSLNKAIESEKGNINTVTDAASVLSKAGYNIENKLSKDEYVLTFDIDKKCFIGMNGDSVIAAPDGYSLNSNTYHLFQVTDGYNGHSNYSQYLTSNFSGATNLYVTTGLDTGSNNNIKNVKYNNTTGVKKDVIFNVNCDYFDITATSDVITRYGEVNNFYVNDGFEGQVHDYGISSYIQVNSGDYYLENTSETDVFEIPTGKSATAYQAKGSEVLAALPYGVVESQCIVSEYLIKDDDDLQTVLNNTKYNFFRLDTEARDIVLTNTKIDIKRSIFFDLNGRSITFLGGGDTSIDIHEESTGGTSTKDFKTAFYINGNGSDADVFIMDTAGVLLQRAGINVADCSIIIEGNKNDTDTEVNLYLNSGKIHDIRGSETVPDAVNSAAVMVFGNVVDNVKNREARNATFNMYGGYIKSEVGSQWTSGACAYKCIQPRGKGSVVNMIYGDLESFHYCISGQGTGQAGATANEVDVYGETVINIKGGNFVGGHSDNVKVSDYLEYSTLFFPQSGSVNITGGNFTGPTCLNAKAGKIKIDGGVFNATKAHTGSEVAGESGSTTDGSVIFAEANNFYTGASLDPLKIEITKTTMTSKNAYILKCSGHINSTKIKQPAVTFIVDDGNFTYAIEGKGYANDDAAKDAFFPTINGGTWVYKK